MLAVSGVWLCAAACASAGAVGACAATLWQRARKRPRVQPDGNGLDRAGLAGWVVGYVVRTSRRLSFGVTSPLVRGRRTRKAEAWLNEHAAKAGVASEVTAEGLCEARLRLAFGAAAVGAVVGAVLSTELAVLLGAAGAVAGFVAPKRSVLSLECSRAAELERCLSEMLEVVALGLRSGLTFDRSFELYGSHFDSSLAHACCQAQRRWSHGLMTREEALRDLASSYSSPVLARVVENAVRSLRFGSSLSEGFESAATEARAVHRAQVEERVAKAPVKMMVPTGTLILPAMLLLVLGPVLLELAGGF